jgi:hypothetical protein
MKKPIWLKWGSEAKKFGFAAMNIIFAAAALGLLPDPYGKYVAVAAAVLSAAGVYNAKNTPPTV